MDGERQQQNGDAHDDLDFSMASDGSHLIWHNHGDEMDDLLESDPNMSNNDDTDAAATDDNGGATGSNQRTARRRAKRHRREQIQQLETVFQECPHPDEKLRQELSKRVGMDPLQVKFWFQNRRSSKKNQIEKQESKVIRGENEVLRAENQAIRAAILKKICPTCGGPTVPIVETPEQWRLRIENARLKDEILRASAVLNMFSGKEPAAPIPTPAGGRYELDLAIDLNIVDPHVGAVMHDPVMPLPPRSALVDPMLLLAAETCSRGHCAAAQGDGGRAALLRHVRRASEEFIMLAQKGEPMWVPTQDGEVLNLQEYTNATFPSMFGLCPVGFAVDATRDIGMVMGNAADLVDILSDARRWSDMFPGIVAGVTASDIVTTGLSRHGLTQLMNAELRVLSPRVPVRKVKFVRHVKMVEPSLWAVVDVSVDGILGQDGGSMADLRARNDGYTACRLLPSGCLIQDINNGYCKVTWIVNAEYDETNVPPLFHPLLRSGQALGACRWLASLQRQCEYLAVLRSDLVPSLSSTGSIPPEKRNGVLKMAQRMMASFYAALCGPAGPVWGVDDWRGGCGVGAERFELVVRVVTSRAGGSVPGAGEQDGYLVVSATTTVWLPGTPAQRVFDYLCDGDRRGEWDALANGAPVQDECYVATGQLHGNAVSVLRPIRPSAFDGTDSNKLILQEVCTDASCMLVAYAAIDEQSMNEVLNGGGHASFSFLPSGFVILPDGHSEPRVSPVAAELSSSAPVSNRNIAGSLVSAMYQTVLSGTTPENLAAETVDNIGNLLCHAIKNIKDAINANIIVTA